VGSGVLGDGGEGVAKCSDGAIDKGIVGDEKGDGGVKTLGLVQNEQKTRNWEEDAWGNPEQTSSKLANLDRGKWDIQGFC